MPTVVMHCCPMMTEQVSGVCGRHADDFDCPDSLVHYNPGPGTYGLIIHDGGSSVVAIGYCPWCGTSLRAS